jgi:hypothetical protein
MQYRTDKNFILLYKVNTFILLQLTLLLLVLLLRLRIIFRVDTNELIARQDLSNA